MDDASLLAEFQAAVGDFERHRTFAERARARAKDFPAEVVTRVVSDHIERGMAAVERVIPLTRRLEQAAEALEARRLAAVEAGRPLHEAREEIDLRAMIGEITEDEQAAELAALGTALEAAEAELAAAQGELSAVREALDRWSSLGHDAGVLAPGGHEDHEELELVDDVEGDPQVLEELDLLLPDN